MPEHLHVVDNPMAEAGSWIEQHYSRRTKRENVIILPAALNHPGYDVLQVLWSDQLPPLLVATEVKMSFPDSQTKVDPKEDIISKYNATAQAYTQAFGDWKHPPTLVFIGIFYRDTYRTTSADIPDGNIMVYGKQGVRNIMGETMSRLLDMA